MRADDILDLARRILRRLEGEEAYGLAAMPPGTATLLNALGNVSCRTQPPETTISHGRTLR